MNDPTYQELNQHYRKAVEQINELMVERDQLKAQLAEFHAAMDQAQSACAEQCAALRHIWEVDEMGWITDANSIAGRVECVKCGAKAGLASDIVHSNDCDEGIIYHALSLDCGKGYFDVSELRPTIELLSKLWPAMKADYLTVSVNEEWKRLKTLQRKALSGANDATASTRASD